MLEEVRVDLPGLDRVVRRDVVGELDDLEGDAFFGEIGRDEVEDRGVRLGGRPDGEHGVVLLLASDEGGKRDRGERRDLDDVLHGTLLIF